MNPSRFLIIAGMLASLSIQPIHAKRSFWNSPDAYLGQTRPSDTPVVFAHGMLADNGTFVMGRVAFSKDG
ncbi:MAG TPA: hypothetical protein VJX67_17520, partial [Blastocatellia bacterium]|nr:hypothetical protein [Blastocatellia bacterium]